MAVSALVTTAGSASANAYVSVEVANQYHQDKPTHSNPWFSSKERAQAILAATKALDRYVLYAGTRTDTTQALEWPRSGLVYPSGVAVPTNIIPTELQHACADLAAQMLGSDRETDNAAQRYGLESLKVPGVSMKFAKANAPSARLIPPAVMALLPDDWAMSRRGLRRIARA